MLIVPFQVGVPQAELDDLRNRLANTRLPDQIPGTSWEYGTERGYLEELLTYWMNEFDWRAQEARINAFDQFTTEIDDVNMHFIHQRSANPDAIPLMIVHGWPGSISEFLDIIPPLVDPAAHGGEIEDAFHVIAPSLPGFGFSGIPEARGYNPERIALMLAALMERLGYESYAIAGGDWGAIINRHLANHYPERLIGLHSNMILAAPPEDEEQRNRATPEELALTGARAAYMQNETGYQAIQGTKPQTLGYGLADSPAGVAAWIVEKFHGWTDMPQGPEGDLDDHFSKDDLLTNISIYWFTGTITSSTRIYYENRNTPAEKPIEYIDVPTGAAIFPAEIYMAPRAWAEAAYDLRHWTVMPRGGHFAALEQPELYLNDLREFFRLLR
ncbi:MAG: epoxide hydrolase [Gammaproteobacteria bacterium]|nr:epoxide hydrolase [Gammaproteobacteria bacterium]MXX07636.1 epoxide hydrolase [Gammaproteobacteria bacterium]MXY90889.1 epoxide hydrolase [Gammaproteobacteria bacterium]MYE29714.1 epoxide hydrolase [Gammaproteobacteria bacterium]MYG96573.1 epoxide hydrolase [Gammaproteobacteria bacterium]